MSSFSRFQKINQIRGVANQKTNSSFIIKGYPTITITTPDGSNQHSACVVNRQEKDMAYIYTYKDEPLVAGQIWGAKGLNWLILEEIVIIKEVNWRKYEALLCNVQIDNLWGYFLGSEASYINVSLKQDVLLQSQQKHILVLPGMPLEIEDKVVINGRAWLIQECDNITRQNVSYYSLRPTTSSKQSLKEPTEAVIEKSLLVKPQLTEPQQIDQTIIIDPNEDIILETENGIFKTSNNNIKIKSLTATEVIFTLPFGVPSATITIQQGNELIEYFCHHTDFIEKE